MKNFNIKNLRIGIFSMLILSLLFVSHTFFSKRVSAESIALVNITDVINSGYSKAILKQPTDTMYKVPNLYFSVGENGKDSISNLLMIDIYYQDSPYSSALFNYGKNGHPVSIQGAIAQEALLANDERVALNFSKGNYYIVIIGPNKQKVESLAKIIANKI
jgi:hypothetical protein